MRSPARWTQGAASAPVGTETVDQETDAQGLLSGWRDQLPALGWSLLLVYLPAVLLLGIALVQRRVAIPDLFRDVNSVAGVPFYSGFYSQLGIVGWCAATVVCLFSWAVLRQMRGAGEWPAFLLSVGGLSGILLFDDLFLFHEAVLPKLLPFAEPLMYLAYAIASVALVLRFRRIILGTPYLLLILALGLLGMSEAIDTVIGRLVTETGEVFTAYRIFVEDGGKFLGIVGWCAYLTLICATKLRTLLGGDNLPAPLRR